MKQVGITIYHERANNAIDGIKTVTDAYKIAMQKMHYDTERVLIDTLVCACSAFEKDGKIVGYLTQENTASDITISVTIIE